MRQQPEILGFVPDASGDDRGMNAEALRQRDHRQGRRVEARPACLPGLARDQPLFGPLVRFLLFPVALNAFDVAQAQIVDKGFDAVLSK